MKCLPTTKVQKAKGNVLHDWHAEVLSLRAFNHFLLSECLRLARSSGEASLFLRRRTDEERCMSRRDDGSSRGWQAQPFAIQDDIRLHMYCSEAPCGDASMELTMAAQEDAAPWENPSVAGIDGDCNSSSILAGHDQSLPGRAYFSQLGVVRRKPARGDAPITLSKSCSDKLALKESTSVLSSVVALFIHPENAYIDTVVLPQSQFSAAGCERSFSAKGRMNCLDGRGWEGGYAFRPFHVQTTSLEFEFSKRSVQASSEKITASNMAAAWNAGGVDEGLINGVLQGRRAFDVKGASLVSRRRMWALAREVAETLAATSGIQKQLAAPTYEEAKAKGECTAVRRFVVEDVKRGALAGWVANPGDLDFGLE